MIVSVCICVHACVQQIIMNNFKYVSMWIQIDDNEFIAATMILLQLVLHKLQEWKVQGKTQHNWSCSQWLRFCSSCQHITHLSQCLLSKDSFLQRRWYAGDLRNYEPLITYKTPSGTKMQCVQYFSVYSIIYIHIHCVVFMQFSSR